MRSENPKIPPTALLEQEPSPTGNLADVATLFLVNRRCPWNCVMCDLWKNTLPHDTPRGSIPTQIKEALASLTKPGTTTPPPATIKLYNSGSFFDPRAVPPEDHPAIAGLLQGFERVIVECHPALIGESALRFRDHLNTDTAFEIAMGLETVHPEVLPKLNKGMTLAQFERAADFLHTHDIALRAFILVKPPFLDEADAVPWSNRTLDFAIHCHAAVASLIPTRLGNEPLDQLASQGLFTPPKLSTLEQALEYGLRLAKLRVFADLWDLEKFSDCSSCFQARRQRLTRINATQTIEPAVACPDCPAADQ